MIPLLIGAAMGLAKAKKEGDQRQRDIALKAATAQYSPWTKMNANDVQVTNANGGIAEGAQGALSGYNFMQAQNAADMQNQLQQAQIRKENALADKALGIGSLGQQQMTMLPAQRSYRGATA